ncbi:hypothetical protein [Streptomyces sp. NPDC007205]|uniref:hypothetical protein n=1 Tax=Streptomyces sp. NPDC007205 TaxID=3154316 RepID=UPI0034013A4B
MATGESEETARTGLTDPVHLIPMPTLAQARGEARVFQALAAYGRHRPALTRAPFGIRSLTPAPTNCVSAGEAARY